MATHENVQREFRFTPPDGVERTYLVHYTPNTGGFDVAVYCPGDNTIHGAARLERTGSEGVRLVERNGLHPRHGMSALDADRLWEAAAQALAAALGPA